MKEFILVLSVFLGLSAQADQNRKPIAGNEDAPVTIQVFSDFLCPYCAKGEKSVSEAVKDFPEKVKVVFRNMPMEFHGAIADQAARAFNAIYLQEPTSAYKFQQQLFENQEKLSQQGEKFIFSTADKLKVNISQMKADMKSKPVEKMLQEDLALAKKLKITGTPTFMIGSQQIVGAYPYSKIKQVIEEELKGSLK